MLITRISGCKVNAFVLIDKVFALFCLLVYSCIVNRNLIMLFISLYKLVCWGFYNSKVCLYKQGTCFLRFYLMISLNIFKI